MKTNFTRVILAALLSVLAMGAKADETLWTDYSPNGEKFSNTNVSIDFSTQYLEAVLDLTNCTGTNENILSIGQNIDLWGNVTGAAGNVIHIYRKAANTVNIWYFNNKSGTPKDNISISNQDNLTIILSSDGLYINGTQYVTATQCANILALSTIEVGSQEGATRSKATYKSVKVVDKVVDPNKPVVGESYYIVPATNTSKGLYVKDNTETTTLITVGDLTEDTKYQWTLFKSPYSSSLLYYNCFQNVYSGFGLDANSGNATTGNPCQWRIEGSGTNQYTSANVNQDYDLIAQGDGTYKMAISNGSTYYLKWDGSSETLKLTTILEDATSFWFKNVKTTTFEKEVTLDETLESNYTTISGLTSGATYTFKIKRTLKTDTWSTIILPFAVSEEQLTEVFGSDVKVARFSGFSNYTLGFATVTEMSKATPYIIRIGEEAANGYDSETGWTFTGITEWTGDVVDVKQGGYDTTTMTTLGNIKFHGTYDKTTVYITGTSYGKYALGTDNKVYHISKTTEQKGFRAIFEEQWYESDSSAKITSWTLDDGGQTTAIDAIDGQAAPMQPQNVYNLAGQLVRAGATTTDGLAKGIYVIGGRKVVKK